jgi:Flp pilus assembly protein TadD
MKKNDKPVGARVWILSPAFDLTFFILTPVLVTLVLIPIARFFPPAEFAAFLLAFFTFGHHLPGFLRAYFDADLFRRHRLVFIATPPAVFVLAFELARWNLHGLLLVVFTWDIWHVLMQQYGFLRIYDAKVGRTDSFTAWADRTVALSWYVTLIAMSPHYTHNFLFRAYSAGIPTVPSTVLLVTRTLLLILSITVSLIYLIREFMLWRGGASLNWRKLAALILFLVVTWYLYVSYSDFVVGFAVWSAFHCIQYYAIVWAYNRNRLQRDGTVRGLLAFLFRPRFTMIGLYVVLIFAYGAVNWSGRYLDRGLLYGLLAAFVVTSGTLHYYFDGFIWRVRDAETRGALAIPGRGKLFVWRRWRKPELLQAVVAALAVLILVVAERSRPRDPLQISHALTVSSPAVTRARREYADALRRQGRYDQAAETYQAVMHDGRPDAELLQEYGLSLAVLGRNGDAISAFRKALAIDPGFRSARYNLASLLAQAGDSRAAMQEFRAAFPDEDAWKELQKDPHATDILTNVAMGLLQAGDRAGARRLLERAIGIKPSNATAHLNLGSLLVLSGDLAGARVHYLAAMEQGSPEVRASAERVLRGLPAR